MIGGGTETVGLIQQFVERTGQLYSLPAVAAEVLHLTGEPQVDPRQLRQCIESDPALAARLLRVVNSSLFGPTRPVTDLNQAFAGLERGQIWRRSYRTTGRRWETAPIRLSSA